MCTGIAVGDDRGFADGQWFLGRVPFSAGDGGENLFDVGTALV